MSELQDLFEQSNPIPKGITRCGDHYAQTEYMLIDPYASNYAARFRGFMEGVKHQQAKIDELQERVDAAKQLIEDLNKCYQQDHQNKFEYWRGFADSAGILGKRLEQALKGGNE